MSRIDVAPQKLRERTRALSRRFEETWRENDPAVVQRKLNAAMRLLLDAQSLAARSYPPTRFHLEQAHENADYAKDRLMERTRGPSGAALSHAATVGPAAIVRSVARIPLRPAFKVGDDTPRGRVTDIGEYSSSDGWLYRVTSERGVRDQVWESTLVWPALHGRGGRLRGAARRRAAGVRDRSRRDNGDRGAAFIEDVRRQLDVGDRQVGMRSGQGTVFITLINLPRGVGGAGGGAEAENNRLTLVVRGFNREPGSKVQVETAVSNLYKGGGFPSRENRVSVRGRTGTEQAIARYVAESLSRITREVPPNFTHTGRDRSRVRVRRRSR